MQGDSWRLPVPLRRGKYRLVVSGWRNPHHGILDLTLNKKALSPSEGLDWYAEASTSLYTFPAIHFDVEATGTHILRGETCRCHEHALGAKYWMCLESIRISPVDEVCKEEDETLEEEKAAGVSKWRQVWASRAKTRSMNANATAGRRNGSYKRSTKSYKKRTYVKDRRIYTVLVATRSGDKVYKVWEHSDDKMNEHFGAADVEGKECFSFTDIRDKTLTNVVLRAGWRYKMTLRWNPEKDAKDGSKGDWQDIRQWYSERDSKRETARRRPNGRWHQAWARRG
jgi:hypothetical protein